MGSGSKTRDERDYIYLHEEKFKVNIIVGDRTSKKEYFYKGLKKIKNYNDYIVFVLGGRTSYKCKKEGFIDKKQEELFFFGLNKHKIKVIDKIKEVK